MDLDGEPNAREIFGEKISNDLFVAVIVLVIRNSLHLTREVRSLTAENAVRRAASAETLAT